MKPQPEPDVTVNRKTLRQLLVKSFSDEALVNLCFDYFPPVYDRIRENSFGKNVLARTLIDYCERHGVIKHLLPLIKEHNPYQYSLREEALFQANALPPPSGEQPKVTLELTFPRLDLAGFTPDKQAILIQLIAEELNIPPEEITIVNIRQGSVIVELRLPSQAARRLITLFYAGAPFLQDLGLGAIKRAPKLTLWQKALRFLAKLGGDSNVLIILLMSTTLLIGVTLLPALTPQGQDLAGSPGQEAPPEPEVTPVAPSQLVPPPTSTSPPVPTASPSPRLSASARAAPLPSLTPGSPPALTRTPAGPPPISRPVNTVIIDGPQAVAAGRPFKVVVRLTDIVPPGVFGGQFKLIYEPAYLEVVAIEPNLELLVVKEAFDNERGEATFVASRHTDVPNFTKEVDFVTFTFRPKPTAAGRTTIAAAEIKFGAKGGVQVPAVVESLTLAVE